MSCPVLLDRVRLPIEELQHNLDDWMVYYNSARTHQGKMCCGRTPMQTLIDGREVWNDKINALNN